MGILFDRRLLLTIRKMVFKSNSLEYLHKERENHDSWTQVETLIGKSVDQLGELRKDAFQRLVPSIQTDETSSRSSSSLPPELTVVDLQQAWIENRQRNSILKRSSIVMRKTLVRFF